MSDQKDLTQQEIQRYKDLDTKTPVQARQYVMEDLEISRYLYYEWVYPLIEDEFITRFISEDRQSGSDVRIPTYRLDEAIAYINKKFDGNVKTVAEDKEF